jgi:hypothetical protein
MASIYCQELIRNSKLLCENYVGEILFRADKNKQDQIEEDIDPEKING